MQDGWDPGVELWGGDWEAVTVSELLSEIQMSASQAQALLETVWNLSGDKAREALLAIAQEIDGADEIHAARDLAAKHGVRPALFL